METAENDPSDWRQARNKLRSQTSWFFPLLASLLENDSDEQHEERKRWLVVKITAFYDM